MTLDAQLIIHPYSARADVGFGHDRYAYELLRHLPLQSVTPRTLDTGAQSGVVGALIAETVAVSRLLRGKRAQVYHATATVNAQCAITARRGPLVTTIHDVIWCVVGAKHDTFIKYFLKKQAIRRAAHASDAVIVPFPSTRDYLVDELDVPRERIRLVPYGVDPLQFFPRREGESVARPAFFPQTGRVVLFVGQLTTGKGVDTLIRCFPQVVREVPDAHLVLGSSGWHEGRLRELYEQCPVKDRIRFSGFIPEKELRDAYVAADVMAFPSRYGFGLSTLESMACGTPTVSGKALDAPDLVGDAGLLADPDRHDELAAQLVRVLRDSKLQADLRGRGLRLSARYRWEKMASETAEVYRELSGAALTETEKRRKVVG